MLQRGLSAHSGRLPLTCCLPQVDVKKKAQQKKAAKAKAAREAEASRPGGEVGADGLTYKQRQNRKRAEKKKQERELIEQLKKQGKKAA